MRRSWLRLFWAAVLVVAMLAGYVVSSGLGERLLHREIEVQLSRLLKGSVAIDEVDLRFERGLKLEAQGLRAYPSPDPDQLPALRAQRVLAAIDPMALLIGRLELSSLVFEAPRVRLERAQDGSIANLPFALWSRTETPEPPTEPAEALLARIESLDAATAEVLAALDIADRVEIRDGTARWIDHSAVDEGGETIDLRLELVTGVMTRDWLSGAVQLEWSGVFLDGLHAPFPIELSIEGDEDAGFAWQFAVSQLPIDVDESRLELLGGVEELQAKLDAELSLARQANGVRRLEMAGALRDASLRLRRSQAKLRRDRIVWSAAIELDRDRLRLPQIRLAGPKLQIDLEGSVARPIRPASLARFGAQMRGAELMDLLDLARSLESESEMARNISRVTQPVEGGYIDYIRTAGTARLARWEELATGRSRDLPEGFLLGGAFHGIAVRTEPGARLEQVAGEFEWVEDQITLRHLIGEYRERALPQLDAVVEGVSHLVAASNGSRALEVDPPPLPGLAPLAELIKPKHPDRPPPVRALGLAIDHLDHPILRFPMRDLRVYVEPLRGGLELQIREGRWAGAPIEGEVVVFNDPLAPSVSASLKAGPATPEAVPPEPADPAAALAESGTREAPSASSASAAPASPETASAAPASPDTAPPEPASPEAPAVPRPATTAASPASEQGKETEGGTPTETTKGRPARWASGSFEMEFRPRPKIPFQNARGFFRLEATELRLDEVELELETRGEMAARAVLDLRDSETVGIDLSFALTDGDMPTLSPLMGLPADLATGRLQATGSLEGALRPHTLLVAEVAGKVRAEAREGIVRTEVPLLLRLSRATEGYNPFANEDELAYESMRATIKLDHGELSSEDFVLEGPLRVFATARIGTTRRPADIRAVVGIFLFRAADQILDTLPLVRALLPGSEHGLIGAYYEVEGPIREPEIESLPMKTLMSSVPGAITAPFKVLRSIFEGRKDEDI